MMELDEALLGTATAVTGHEGAAPAVAKPDRTLDLGWDVTRAGDKAAAPARAVRGGQLLLGEVLQERRQRSIEDRRRIPVRDLMAQEVLREPELLVRFGAHRELHLIALGRQRDDSSRTSLGRLEGCSRQAWSYRAVAVTGRLRTGRRLLLGRRRCRGVARSREPADQGWNRRLRTQPCEELLHLSLALVPSHVQDFSVVLLSQMGREESHRRQVHRSHLEHLEYDRKTPDHPGGFDAPIGGVLGEMEHLRAIGKQRRAAFGEVETSFVQFREVSDEGRGRLTLALGQVLHPGEQLVIGKVTHSGEHPRIHSLYIPWRFGIAQDHPGSRLAARTLSTGLRSAENSSPRSWRL